MPGSRVASTVAAGLALALGGTSGARAAPLRLDAGATRVVVERSPLRLRFLDARGRQVLAQAPAASARSTPLPPTRDPEPFALEREPDHAVYAPFAFEVGTEERAQWHGAYWAGNLLFSRRSGTVAHAVRVLAARRPRPGELRLVLATTEPGRTLAVRLTRDRGGAIRVRVAPSDRSGVITMGDSFTTGPDEAFHGLGGRRWGVDQRGHKLYGWTEQESFGGPETLTRGLPLFASLIEPATGFAPEALGGAVSLGELPGGLEHYLATGGPSATYYAQDHFISSRGYAFLLARDELTRWRLADDRPDRWQAQVSAPALDYTVGAGRGAAAVRRLTAITGRQRLPPAWSQDASLSRGVQSGSAETPAGYVAKVERDLREIRRRHAPVSAFSFEGWGLVGDAVTRRVVRRLHRAGLRAVLYVRAYVSDDPLNTQPRGDVETVLRRGLVATDARGRPFAFGPTAGTDAPAYLLDLTDPAAVRWYRDRIRRMLDLGADGFMYDFGEQVQDGMRFHDGSTGAAMHNRYPRVYGRVTRRIVAAEERRRGRRILAFNRAGFSGRPGSAAVETTTFPGDETADWSAGTGLASLGPDLLNRAVGGVYGYTTDIAGYVDQLTGPADAELFTRWTQFAALTPFMRVHNSVASGTRMPWDYDEATYRRWVAAVRLHRRAIPLVRRRWRVARRTGMPPLRPLWLAAPEAPGARTEDQEWLLGDDVLVAPVVVRGARTRDVSFPAGCWRDARTGHRYRGPRRATVPAPLHALPHFTRCGTRPLRRSAGR